MELLPSKKILEEIEFEENDFSYLVKLSPPEKKFKDPLVFSETFFQTSKKISRKIAYSILKDGVCSAIFLGQGNFLGRKKYFIFWVLKNQRFLTCSGITTL